MYMYRSRMMLPCVSTTPPCCTMLLAVVAPEPRCTHTARALLTCAHDETGGGCVVRVCAMPSRGVWHAPRGVSARVCVAYEVGQRTVSK